MSTHYKHNDEIPVTIIIARLRELATAVTKGREHVAREFVMRIPAERDHDADLVLSYAASLLEGAVVKRMHAHVSWRALESGMITHYKYNDKIPVTIIIARLRELATAVTKGRDHDADLVLSYAASLLEGATDTVTPIRTQLDAGSQDGGGMDVRRKAIDAAGGYGGITAKDWHDMCMAAERKQDGLEQDALRLTHQCKKLADEVARMKATPGLGTATPLTIDPTLEGPNMLPNALAPVYPRKVGPCT